MKLFHVGDVLSLTTSRLVSPRGMDGIYAILSFLTGDEVYTHQIPRIMDECLPWMRALFPTLMADTADMALRVAMLDAMLAAIPENGQRKRLMELMVVDWVENTRLDLGMPQMIPVYELGADMHTHIDPMEEAMAMFGDVRVVKVVL